MKLLGYVEHIYIGNYNETLTLRGQVDNSAIFKFYVTTHKL